jgi:hypothetical protein
LPRRVASSFAASLARDRHRRERGVAQRLGMDAAQRTVSIGPKVASRWMPTSISTPARHHGLDQHAADIGAGNALRCGEHVCIGVRDRLGALDPERYRARVGLVRDLRRLDLSATGRPSAAAAAIASCALVARRESASLIPYSPSSGAASYSHSTVASRFDALRRPVCTSPRRPKRTEQQTFL